MMRTYLISGFFRFYGGESQPFADLFVLGAGEVMDKRGLQETERRLVVEQNRKSTIAKSAHITHFQLLEQQPLPVAPPIPEPLPVAPKDPQPLPVAPTQPELNAPDVLPPVECPIFIQIARNSPLILVERTSHVAGRGDVMEYQITQALIHGRFPWTYP